MSPEELQSLNERFQAMAQSDADKQAPAHVEAALLAAFREQSKPRVVEIRRKRPAWLWVAAAAAAVVRGLRRHTCAQAASGSRSRAANCARTSANSLHPQLHRCL